MEGQGSSSAPPSIDVFWREKQSDQTVSQLQKTRFNPTKLVSSDNHSLLVQSFQVYPGSRKAIYHRVALVITNITFTNKDLNRKGAEKDEENMETLLKGLGYEVVKYRNLTGRVGGAPNEIKHLGVCFHV